MIRSQALQPAEWHSRARRDYLALWDGQWARWEEGVHATRLPACMQLCSSQWALHHTIGQAIDEGARGWTREAALGD